MLLQPKDVPVTVYTVDAAGLTTATDELPPAGNQAYVVAPVAVKLAEVPEHNVLVDAATVTVGTGLTVRVTTAVFEQVVAGSIAVTVYDGLIGLVPGVTGVTVMVLLLTAPGFHCQLIPPAPWVNLCPEKTMFGLTLVASIRLVEPMPADVDELAAARDAAEVLSAYKKVVATKLAV